MTLTIGGIDRTHAIEEGSLVLRYYGALRSAFQVTLQFDTRPLTLPRAGEEIKITEGSETVWGGIAVETQQICRSATSFSLSVRGQGYEQILQRYCMPGFTLARQNPSDAVDTAFHNYLNPADGLTMGSRAGGISETKVYTFPPAKASWVFDRLAEENGFVWWVDKEKSFHLQPKIPTPPQRKSIDLTETQSDRLKDLQTLVYRESTAEYKNTQYLYNKADGITGQYQHLDRLREMANRYGSGQYGAAAENTVVKTLSAAQSVARQMISNSPGLGEIEFTTDDSTFALGQFIPVIAPVCGIDSEEWFCVTQVKAVYFYNQFRYTVTARRSDGDSIALTSWEAVLANATAK